MKRTLIRWKIYYDRARMYVGMVQSLMIVTMFMEILGLNISRIWYIPIFIGFTVASLVVGYYDTKMGLRSEEIRNNTVQNPVIMEILETVRHIKEERAEETRSIERLDELIAELNPNRRQEPPEQN